MKTHTIEVQIPTTQAEVAEIFGVSTRTVQKWIARGCPGRPGHYPIADVLEWVMAIIHGRCVTCRCDLPKGHPMLDPNPRDGEDGE